MIKPLKYFVSGIPSDFKSGTALRIRKVLRHTQLKNAAMVKEQYGGSGSSSGGQPSSGEKKSHRGKAKKKLE